MGLEILWTLLILILFVLARSSCWTWTRMSIKYFILSLDSKKLFVSLKTIDHWKPLQMPTNKNNIKVFQCFKLTVIALLFYLALQLNLNNQMATEGNLVCL